MGEKQSRQDAENWPNPTKKEGVTLARNPLVHVVGGIGFEPTTPAV